MKNRICPKCLMVIGADRYTKHHCKKYEKYERLMELKQEIADMKLVTTGENK